MWNNPVFWQWTVLILFGIGFFFLAPFSKKAAEFFAAENKKGKTPGFFLLMSSLLISWIFAKSITNAANLGMDFGIVGGVSYGIYYFAFIVAGVIIYRMRTRGGFKSIHQFLESRYGKGAVLLFSLLIGIRLFNEVWSNTMVIGSYFGDAGSSAYYISILVFTGLTLAYVIKGGMRSSLLTDAIQLVFFGVLIFVLLALIMPQSSQGIGDYFASGEWTMAAGMNLAVVAFLQIFSYPFHDPVLTDRAFISSPKVTLKSFLWASIIGFCCIVLFSFVGIFAQFKGLEGQAPVEVGKLLGAVTMLAMNFIMITSAASTLDSAFSAFAKLWVIDLGTTKEQSVKKGRLVMVLIAVAGTLPVFLNPEILSATTVSGTMVIGLAPVFLFWNVMAPKMSFHLAVGFGILIGITLATGLFPEGLHFTTGKYADALAANVYGTIGCVLLFVAPILVSKWTTKNVQKA